MMMMKVYNLSIDLCCPDVGLAPEEVVKKFL
jgi:hypothetical protein